MKEWITQFTEANPLLTNIIFFALIIIIILIIRRFTMNRLYKQYKSSENWYVTQKIARWMSNVIFALSFIYIFGNDLSGFTTAIGLAGAGITYALREVIVSFAGWFAIMFGDFFKTGDRVLLGGSKGDVVDIGILRTTLMELGEWVEGDQYTGRIVRVANSYIFNSPVYNYNADFKFLWDELHVPLHFESDIPLAKKIILQIAEETIGDYNEQAELEWHKMKRRYRIEHASLKSQVFAAFDDNFVTLSLRYIVDTRERRGVKDRISIAILEQFEKESDRIELASETFEIVHQERRQKTGNF
ncbi:mechanosensitive ion channel family protein [Alkalibacterium kapii]|uniref:Mechanosensitive ion channel protein MscS n=1 Tax=Alkalibacterium kapii TaxID=426704 RepID=A0A511AX78_9LACT|nr:mechanosensitive ion channel family protein [Alkalibacterium kapii]GEK91731.1 mechanosensitive ion channel protein MscS [Alkalibacterium kapii]